MRILSKIPKPLKALLQYAAAGGILYWLMSHIGWQEIWDKARELPLWLLVLAFVLFNAQQIINVERLHFYCQRQAIRIPRKLLALLHYVSQCFNMLVPGGVGADAYRVYVFKQLYGISLPVAIRLKISNRVSGLVALGIWGVLILMVLPLSISGWVKVTVAIMGLAGVFLGYGLLLKLLLKEDIDTAISAQFYSMTGQGFALGSIACLAYGLHPEGELLAYLLLFIAAFIVGMIPITLGGLGTREATFFFGAQFLSHLMDNPVNPEVGVTISLISFAMTLLVAIIGVLCLPFYRKVVTGIEAQRPTET